MGVKPFRLFAALILAVLAGNPLSAQAPPRSAVPYASDGRQADRWILVLEDPPVAELIEGRSFLETAEARLARQRIRSSQSRLRSLLRARGIPVAGATDIILNAVFVVASARDAVDLATFPGVQQVVPDRPIKRNGTRAWELVNAGMAWHIGGGLDEAGLGVRIGIVDTGIDQAHPAFQDNSLPETPKYCTGDECAYTNRKVIAARSYVRLLALPGDPEYSRPDDLSPRDRVGHGTAVASLAGGVPHSTNLGTMVGVAPKAYLGNYKVFGSPGVNDVTFTSVVATALEEALLDGMDVVTLSLSFPATFGPNDTAPAECSDLPVGAACDPWANVAKNLARLGMTAVVAAGNEGDNALWLPAQNTVRSPGTVPDVITVGATTNSHHLYQSVRVGGGSVPEPLQRIIGLFGNGPVPKNALSGKLIPASRLDVDGKACAPLPRGSLDNAFALIEAGNCSLRTKVTYAHEAGARAVVFVRGPGDNFVFAPASLAYTAIPLILIGHDDGVDLREFINANTDRDVTLDPAFDEYGNDYPDVIAYFSSLGPAIGTSAIKPEVVAPGTNMYVATQKHDANSDMYNASGYTTVQGTSFAVPIVAGAVALSRQLLPNLRQMPEYDRFAALKSSVVNTATPMVWDVDDKGNEIFAGVAAMGAGKVDAAEAVSTLITVSPSTVSFGALNLITDRFPVQEGLVFTNHSSVPVRLFVRVEPWTRDDRAQITVSPNTFSLAAFSKSGVVQVRLAGNAPTPGRYEGTLIVEGGGARFQIPYMYVVTDGIPSNLVPMVNFDFVGQESQFLRGGLMFKVVDRYGLPVPNVPVTWRVASGGGRIDGIYTVGGKVVTDRLGISEAYEVYLGPQLGTQVFEAQVPNLDPIQFIGYARPVPRIENGGIVNAATGSAGAGLAPGSLVSIKGNGLSEFSLKAVGPSLPMSLGGISVSFDNATRNVGYPGRILSVSPNRVDVQVPWELQGVPSASVKVSLDGFTNTAPVTATLAAVSPGLWQITDPNTGVFFVDALDDGGNRIWSGNRAKRNSVIVLRANGLGQVANQPASGEPPSGNPPSTVNQQVRVTVDGIEAEVQSAALQAGTVGIYDVRVRVPAGVPGGERSVAVVVTTGGVASPPANLPLAQ